MIQRLLQVYENEVINGATNIETSKSNKSGFPLYIRIIFCVLVVSMITVYVAGVLENREIGYVSAATLLLTLVIFFIWLGIAERNNLKRSDVNLLNQYKCDKILMLKSILIQSKMYSEEVIKILVGQCKELIDGRKKGKKNFQESFLYMLLYATATGGVKIVMDAAKEFYEKLITEELAENINSTLNEAIYTMVLVAVLIIVIVWVVYVWLSQIIPILSGEEKTYSDLTDLKNDLELILAELIEKNK